MGTCLKGEKKKLELFDPNAVKDAPSYQTTSHFTFLVDLSRSRCLDALEKDNFYRKTDPECSFTYCKCKTERS